MQNTLPVCLLFQHSVQFWFETAIPHITVAHCKVCMTKHFVMTYFIGHTIVDAVHNGSKYTCQLDENATEFNIC